MTPFEMLCVDLREAVEMFAMDERAGAGKSLAAMNDYLDHIGVPADLSVPSFALLAALQDLENGKQPEMLKKAKVRHRPPIAIALQLERAQAAAAMQLLMDAGDTKEVAARAVTRALEKNGVLGLTWKEVARWRDELNTRPKDDLAASPFRALVQDYKAHGRKPRDDARALMTDFGWTARKI